MMAAIQHRRSGPANRSQSRFFASSSRARRRAPRSRNARLQKRAAGRKTAPGIFFAPSPETHPASATQTLGSHQENWVCGYDFAPSCAVAPNSTVTVTLDSAPANLPGGGLMADAGLYHQWITTSSGQSAGMGNMNGVPGENGQTSPDLPFSPTQVVDQTGRVPTSTQTYTGVDQGAISTYLTVGTATGAWVPGLNDCNTYAQGAIYNSTPHDVYVAGPGYSYCYPNSVVYADGSIHSPGGGPPPPIQNYTVVPGSG